MIIEVDFDLLCDQKLTPSQFILAHLLHQNDYHNFDKFIAYLNKEVALKEINALESKRYISNLNELDELDPSKLITRTKLKGLFKEEKDEFKELLELYPVKVLRPDGYYDYLRTDLKRCRRLYQGILGTSKVRHKRILKTLKYELTTREQESSMKYMKRLPK